MSRTAMKPEEQFARLLEGSAPISVGVDPALASMAELANALRVVGTAPGMPAPDPAFRAALRQRLVAVATVQVAEPAVPVRPGRRAISTARFRVRRRVAVLAAAVTLATSMAGVGVAATRSLPGYPFYDVKRATEAVQLWGTFGDAAKGRRHLEFARTRLAEAQSLPPTSSHIASTLTAMDAQTREGSNELIAAYRASHSTTALADLVKFSTQQVNGLTQLATTLPAALRSRETQSITVVTGVVTQVHNVAQGVCVLCGPTGVKPGVQTTTTHPRSTTHHSSGRQSQQPKGKHSTAPAPAKSTKPTPSAGSPKHSASPKPTKTPPIPPPSKLLSSILHPKHSKSPLPILSSILGIL
jgi:hypothetical protein